MPSPAAALQVNIWPMRMYFASMTEDLCPVWRMISRSFTPFIAACLQCGSEAVPAKGSRLHPGALCGNLQDPADRVLVKSLAGQVAMPIDLPENGT